MHLLREPRLRRWAKWLLSALGAAGLAVGGHLWWTRPRPTPPTEIFRGVIYVCEDLSGQEECGGLMHLVRVDLAAPAIGIYVTPLDPKALERGYQYRLADASSVLHREGLAVVINATYFSSDSGLWQRAGDWARGVQTIVADGEVSHVDPHSYLLWFESDLTPHVEFTKPPSEAVLRRARWGAGGGAVPLWQGEVREGASGHTMDRCTAVAIDTDRRLLWLAVFENTSASAVARVLAEHGARDGFLLDGGHSTTMVLGPKAAHVRPGTLISGARPVATFLGIRAEPLE